MYYHQLPAEELISGNKIDKKAGIQKDYQVIRQLNKYLIFKIFYENQT
jgi:hypothetical protein